MLPPPPTSTRTAPPFPSTTLFRSVVIGDCPHAHEIAPLLATVGAAIVAQGVSRIGDALKAAGNAETQTALARRNVEFDRSEEHTSELQSIMRISYAVFSLKKKNKRNQY